MRMNQDINIINVDDLTGSIIVKFVTSYVGIYGKSVNPGPNPQTGPAGDPWIPIPVLVNVSIAVVLKATLPPDGDMTPILANRWEW